MPLSPLVRRSDQLILDLDGTIWLGDEPVPGSAEAVKALRDEGKRLAFVTNNPRLPGEDYVRKLWRLGIRASLGDVVTSGAAMQHLLADTRQGATAFVIGTQALFDNVTAAGVRVVNNTDLASRAEVVVVGGTEDVTYADLRDAALAVQRGAELLATGRDPTYPMPDGAWPGTGAIVAAVEIATGKRAAIVGKPEAHLFFTALDRLGEGRTLVVGDRLESDLAAAAKAHLDAALVLTGGADPDAARALQDPAPVAVAEDLSALVNGG